MWLKLLMLVHLCAAFLLKCPEPAQWAVRANGHCADPSKYFCLKNDLINGYSENCTRSDFQQPGRKAVLRGGIDADICSAERYQPFPIKFYTNVSTNCLFLKSFCNEEGQVVYDHGNRNTDTTCRCDYRRGYNFLVKPNNPCFCKPSQEDCSCFLNTCSNGSDILSPDYDCINRTDLTRVMQCRPVTDEKEISSRQPEKTGNITLKDNISFLEPWKKHPTIVIVVLLFGTLLVFIALLTNCFGALIIKDPGSKIHLTEGDSLTLQYNLPTKRFQINIFKDNKSIADENMHIIENVTVEDQGYYFAKVNIITSKITKVTVDSLFINDPGPKTNFTEGEPLTLQYHLRKRVPRIHFYKDGKHIGEKFNAAENVFRKETVTMEDEGYYFAIVNSIKSNITKVTVDSLFVKDPGPETNLIEGESLKLQYSLRKKGLRLHFVKDEKYVAVAENFAENVFRKERVTMEDQGNYFAVVNSIASIITKVTVDSMFTSSFEQIYCIEGEKLQLKCSVYSESIEVEWFKDNLNRYKHTKIERNKNISIDHNGKDHVMTIQTAKMTDSGIYIIIAGNVRKQLPVTVKAFFKRSLENKTIMEGVEVSFECEAEKPYPVAWFKDSHEINLSSKFKKETLGNKVHKLTIQPTTLEDKGTYWIKMKDISSCADLDVKEMPDAVKQMSEHDRNMFLKAAKAGTAVRYYIRIMIVGQNGVGKTCLLRRLMNEHIDDVKSTDGINIEVKKCKINRHTQKWIFTTDEEFSKTAYQNEDFADCGFWDFAGQKEFYATHQTFLSTNAIYLLVVDISKDFASKTPQDMIADQFDNVGGYIDFWLDYIHCYALQGKDDLLNPPVIIIGTGIDKITNEEEISEKKNMLYSLLDKKKEKRRHIRKSYFLSNTKPEKYKTEFENLQKEIFEVAGNIPKWGDNLPTRWIVLEKEIDSQIVEKKKRVISYKEAQHLAKICSFPISEIESELDSFLKYEHEIGNMIFFDDIKSYIVLEPKWLVDTFKCFVSPFQFQCHFVDMPEWSQLKSIGILPENLIKKLFKKVPGFDSVKHTQFALQVMEKFDIIVKPTTLEGNEEYYMPCMINASGFEIVRKTFNVQSKNCSRTSWFCLDFNFLPPSFFNHLLVTFVKKYVLCTDEDGRLQLYRGFGIFNLEKNGCQKLVACLSENSIAVQVWEYHNEEQQICNANYSTIREYLIRTVHLLQLRYKINIQYECFFKCPEGKYYKTAGKVSCDETVDNYFCPEHGSTHSLEEVRKVWVQEGKERKEGCSNEKNNIPVKCHYCEKMPVYRCYECSNVLCDDCYLKHDKLTNTKHHTVQSTNDKLLLNNTFEVSGEILDMKSLPGGLLVFVVFPSDKLLSYKLLSHMFMLLTYSVSDKQRNEISVGKQPRSIAIVDRNTVVVLLSPGLDSNVDSIGIVDIRQRQVIQHVDCTIDLPSYTFCSMFYTDDQLYISNHSGITVMDMSGTIDREIELGFEQRGMCYDTKAARIYCIDHSENKLICIDRDGNTIFTFTDTGLTNVKRLTIDNEGYVLVLCRDDSVKHLKVHRICPDGKSSEVIITGKYNDPYCISSICFQEESDEVVIGIEKKVYTYKNN